MMFIPLLVVFLLFYLLLRNPAGTGRYVTKPDELSPLEILKQRYAQGAITQDEFLRMREELSKRY
ncbi:MAG: SHOCT domain-containing protein [Sphaerochaeta sp.]|nr:SHOCT domain-containing protein [Sphaerochaeta sp.]